MKVTKSKKSKSNIIYETIILQNIELLKKKLNDPISILNPKKINIKNKYEFYKINNHILKLLKYCDKDKKGSIYFNKNFINKLYGFTEPIHYHLVKYNKQKSIKKTRNSKKSAKKRSFIKDRNILDKISSYKSYHYEELNDLQDTKLFAIKIKLNILQELPHKKIPMSVKKATEGLARGVSQYIQINYNLPHKMSNAYVKLWEIYSSVPQLVPRRKQLNVFHLAEAPGQWINCTTHFIETKRQNIENYNWLANSLNAKHPENIKKYGKGIFSDDYGFLKKYPQKWLYGEDDTGDITKSKNVEWFRDYMEKFKKKSNQPIHLITGDAGMNTEIPLKDLQEIEYGQLCMVASCSSIGTNCVIKHFLHLVSDYEESYEGSGFMISFLYLYYLMFEDIRLIKPNTSSPNSSEFYLVGLRFKGIDDSIFKKLMKQLDNYKENHCFFKKEDIPEFFYRQVLDFIKDIFTLNTEQYEVQNMLLTCIVNPDPVIEKATQCKKYLDIEFIKKIQSRRYKEWIKTNRFN